MKHTALPWHRLSNGTATGFHLSNSVIADWANGNHYVGEVKTIGNEANAEFLVRACNCHEEFRIACKGAIAALSQNKTFPADIKAAKQFLNQALANATK